MTDWLTDGRTDGRTDGLIYWLTAWLSDWLTHWLSDWLTDSTQTDRQTDRQTDTWMAYLNCSRLWMPNYHHITVRWHHLHWICNKYVLNNKNRMVYPMAKQRITFALSLPFNRGQLQQKAYWEITLRQKRALLLRERETCTFNLSRNTFRPPVCHKHRV